MSVKSKGAVDYLTFKLSIKSCSKIKHHDNNQLIEVEVQCKGRVIHSIKYLRG